MIRKTRTIRSGDPHAHGQDHTLTTLAISPALPRRGSALRRAAAGALGVLLGLALATSTGCVGHNVYPAEPGDRGFTNVNSDPFPPVLTAALQWAVVRYPPNVSTEFSPAAPAGPDGPFALNLPAGTTPLLAQRIAINVGFGAQTLTPETQDLPIYHVSRVWISGDEAKVDVIRPVRGLPAAGGKDATQAITVRLRGGVQQWRVTSHRTWSFNALPTPALNFITPRPPMRSTRPAPETPADAAPIESAPPEPAGAEPSGAEPASGSTDGQTL